MYYLDTPVSFTVTNTNQWDGNNIDLAAYLPADASVAIFVVRNTRSSVYIHAAGIRPAASAQTHYGKVSYARQITLFTPLTNRVCTLYSDTATYITFYLVGCFQGEEAAGFDTQIDITPGSAGSYQDVDVSGYVPAGGLPIIHLLYTGSTYPQGYVRANGSTDDRYGNNPCSTGWITGVDGAGLCEIKLSTITDAKAWLVGYAKGKGKTNAYDVSLGTTGSYFDIDTNGDGDLPANASAVVVEFYASTGGYSGAIRGDGATGFDLYSTLGVQSGIFMAPLSGGVFEGKISNTNLDFFARAYIYVPPVQQPTAISRDIILHGIDRYDIERDSILHGIDRYDVERDVILKGLAGIGRDAILRGFDTYGDERDLVLRGYATSSILRDFILSGRYSLDRDIILRGLEARQKELDAILRGFASQSLERDFILLGQIESARDFILRGLTGLERDFIISGVSHLDKGAWFMLTGQEAKDNGQDFILKGLNGVGRDFIIPAMPNIEAAFIIRGEEILPAWKTKRLTLLDSLNLRTTAVYRNPRDISVLQIVCGDYTNSKIPCTPLDRDGYMHHVSDRAMQLIDKVYADNEPVGYGYRAYTAYQDETGRRIACVIFDNPQYDKKISVTGKGAFRTDSPAAELIENPADLIRFVFLDVQGYDASSIDLGELLRFYADGLAGEMKVAALLNDFRTIKAFLDELADNIHSQWMISDGKSVMRYRWL